MYRFNALTRTAQATRASTLPSIRTYRPSSSWQGGRAAATSPSDHSASQSKHPDTSARTKGTTTSHEVSATDQNAPKDGTKDKMEAEAAQAGPEVAEAQYGPGNAVEGSYTSGTKEAKDRKEAAKQGE
ncbi:hypothetical protein JCM6882_001681 [Rhodosporidiobolus microsporus]